jgi:HEAT repeat protein
MNMTDHEDDVGQDAEEIGILRALAGEREQTSTPGGMGLREDEIAVVTRTEDQPTVSGIMSELRSPDPEKRRSILRSLVGQPDMRAAAAAASVLRDPDRGIRALAFRVLEGAPHLAPMDALSEAAMDEDPELRGRALRLLGRTGNPAAAEVLDRHLLFETDDHAVRAALQGLADSIASGAGQIDSAVLDRVAASISSLAPARHLRFGEELKRIAEAVPEEELTARLSSARSEIRAGAAILALERATAVALRGLGGLVYDDDPVVRRLAVVGLARVEERDREPAGPASVEAGRPAEPPPAAPQPLQRLHQVPEAAPDPERRPPPEELKEPEAPDWLVEELAGGEAEDVIRAARRVAASGRPDLLARVAEAALRVPAIGEVEGFREAAPWHSVLAEWRGHPDPRRRADALKLSALLHPGDQGIVLAGLADPAAAVRLAAVEVATPVRGTSLDDEVLRLAREDPFPRVRASALAAFTGGAPEARLRAARAMLSHPDAKIRSTAVSLLGGLEAGEAPLLARFLLDPDPEVASRAGELLTRDPSSETLALISGVLLSSGPGTHDRVAEALKAFDPRLVSALAGRAAESTNPAERAVGLRVLAAVHGYRAFGRLVDALADPEADVRLAALEAMRHLPSSGAIDQVGGRLQDPEGRVRMAAVDVLTGIEDDRTFRHLLRAAGDPSDEVRAAARSVILGRRSIFLARILVEALRDPSVRRTAAELLGAMEDLALPLLLEAVEGGDEPTRTAIGEALGAARAEPWLLGLLRDRDPARRRRAVVALGAMGAVGALALVADRLGDPDPAVRAAAAGTLGSFGDPRAVDPLKRAFATDPDMGVVAVIESALRGLEKQGDARPR